MSISTTDRILIIKYIVSHSLFLGKLKDEYTGIVDFLEMIINLRMLPSSDSRCVDAYEDMLQHTVRNYDWDYDYVCIERFPELYNDYELFKKFISVSVHPILFSSDEVDRRKFINDINLQLSKVGLQLVGSDYYEQRIIYIIAPLSQICHQLPDGFPENTIPIYYDYTGEIRYPCLELKADNWNDWFVYQTKFLLVHHQSESSSYDVGLIKLMKRNETKTSTSLPHAFRQLTDDWCSIGMEYSYYEYLKEQFPSMYQSILYALRDTALYPSICELFEEDYCFNNSLIRKESHSINPAILLDSVRWMLQGINVENYYRFKYAFHPPYADADEPPIFLSFDFIYNTPFEQRIYGIIGKNGSGKTTLLSQIAQSFQLANANNISPSKPLYNKVISISFSAFNSFPTPQPDAKFNYRFLGLNNLKGDLKQNIRAELGVHLVNLNKKKRVGQWCSFLKEVLHDKLAQSLVEGAEDDNFYYDINVEQVMSQIEKLSSGENILIYIYTSLLDEIKQNTLILFDEPETHLHPNAISSLMQYMYKLLAEYNSFCILATHSPLVIQEIPSDNVKIFKREDDCLTVQPLAYETFSQDLSLLTECVFGDIPHNRYHYKLFEHLVGNMNGLSYDQIIGVLSNSARPLPLGARMILKTMIEKRDA